MPTMIKNYDPKQSEQQLYAWWQEQGYFHEEPDPNRKPFTVMMPPPNITSQLHIGHALNNTIQDVLVRFKRMQGYCTLWQPGTDHASIATEVKIIEALKAEGLTKQGIGREAYIERAYQWYDRYGGRIVEQLKQMGCSCDWQRLRFTMDEGLCKAVNEVFVRLYEKGLIYRGARLINWCPQCHTALSDAEVEYEPHPGHLWHIQYPLSDGSGHLVVATTRPETMLGDTAIAVHPDDERYRHLVGKTVRLPIMDRDIPIVADSFVDKEFGTGCVKITPAHDPNDYECALRHNLDMISILDESAILNQNAGSYQGLSALQGRAKVVERLDELGLLLRTEDHEHNVGECYRCKATVEPLISTQWFVKMQPLAEPALRVVREGDIKFVPERYAKTYFHWMENIRDWCISRQLWWGHRIPAWYCACGEFIVAREAPAACPACGDTHLTQDEDVLDTWFSSALWPFSTLGWPQKTPDLQYFFPSDVLVTAYEIIFFWVARMIFSSLDNLGDIPFHTVLIHGIMRDAQGRKMSKSLGNGIDPLEVIEQYGADAMRFSLCVGVSAGSDMRYYQEKVESARNFANKIWNASRFLVMNLEDITPTPLAQATLDSADMWLLTRLQETCTQVTRHLEEYELGLAAQSIYDFIWYSLCDWSIEMAKSRLYGEDARQKSDAAGVLLYTLKIALKLLHPFMPFVTEQIWQHLGDAQPSIMMAPWPKAQDIPAYPQQAAQMERAMEIIRAVRNIRAEHRAAPSRRIALTLAATEADQAYLRPLQRYIVSQAGLSEVCFIEPGSAAPRGAATAVCTAGTVILPLGELVDLAQQSARLQKEAESLQRDIAAGQAKLANTGFTSRAPQAVVAAERERLAVNQDKLARLQESLAQLQQMQ